jgi:hypothetical protein
MRGRESSSSVRSSPLIGAELVVLVLILTSLAGGLLLVLSMYRRPAATRERDRVGCPAALTVETRPVSEPEVISPVEVPPLALETEVDDPTPAALQALATRQSEHAQAAQEADRSAEALVQARKTVRASANARNRASMIVRSRAETLERQAEALELDVEMLALERDVLARENERTRAERAQALARARSSYAILPYKGPNGTWRCPITIECRDGQLEIPSDGSRFRLTDLERNPLGRRAFLVTLNLAAGAASRLSAPDGAEVEPYILFVVRPDGIRPYYAGRTILEPLGVPFGYELVVSSTEIEYPDLGDPATWPEAGPLGGEPTLPFPPRSVSPGGVGPGGLVEGQSRVRPPTRSVPIEELFGEERLEELLGRSLGRGDEGRGAVPSGSGRVGPGGLPSALERRHLPPSFPLPPLPGSGSPIAAPRGGLENGLGDNPGALAGIARPRGLSDGLAMPPARTVPPSPAGPSPNGSELGQSDGLGVGPSGSGGSEPARWPIEPEVPRRDLEIVVICSQDGLLIQPGSYRQSVGSLRANPNRLPEHLRAIVQAERLRRPGVFWQPRLRFLVHPGGHQLYQLARGQTLLAGIDWPVQLQVANPDPFRLTGAELQP